MHGRNVPAATAAGALCALMGIAAIIHVWRPIPAAPQFDCEDSAMIDLHVIDDLAKRLAALVPDNARDIHEDLSANFRSTLQGSLRKLELVTREEFDVQRCVLMRTREKVEALEMQLRQLENGPRGGSEADVDG